MNKGYVIILACLVLSCKGKTETETHSHGADTHTHSKEDYFGAYEIEDEKFGSKTTVTISEDERIMVTNSLPNHVTGEFPNEGNPNTISIQNRIFIFPLIPKYSGKAKWIREPGIALNGIKFEPGTGEVVVCESGENYRVEALQNVIDLGLDSNHAHVQPNGTYHYHGTPTAIIENFDSGDDLVHIGFAHDGFPMYYSKSNAYKPSFKLVEGNREGENCAYTRPGINVDISEGGHHDGTFNSDFEYVIGSGDLDECNGITIEGQYMYLVTTEFPFVSRCLMGEFESQERGGPPQGNEHGGIGRQGDDQGQPNVEDLFKDMDSNSDKQISPKEAKGPLKQKFSEVDANKNGLISKDELEKDLSHNNGRRRP